MAVYERPRPKGRAGRPSRTNPDYYIVCRNCRGRFHSTGNDLKLELFKGVAGTSDQVLRGDRDRALEISGAALDANPVPQEGQADTCPRCGGWTHDFHREALRLHAYLEEAHSHLRDGNEDGARAALTEADEFYRRRP